MKTPADPQPYARGKQSPPISTAGASENLIVSPSKTGPRVNQPLSHKTLQSPIETPNTFERLPEYVVTYKTRPPASNIGPVMIETRASTAQLVPSAWRSRIGSSQTIAPPASSLPSASKIETPLVRPPARDSATGRIAHAPPASGHAAAIGQATASNAPHTSQRLTAEPAKAAAQNTTRLPDQRASTPG
jgi:hypothetical protein